MSENTTEQPAKRGPGRPRKNPLPEATEVSTAIGVVTAESHAIDVSALDAGELHLDAGALVAAGATVDQAVALLIKTLGHDEREVQSVEITAAGHIRVVTIDRALRTRRFKGLARYQRDAQNRIIP